MVKRATVGHGSDLHTADQGEKGLEASRHITFHDLDVIEIDQQFQVWVAHPRMMSAAWAVLFRK